MDCVAGHIMHYYDTLVYSPLQALLIDFFLSGAHLREMWAHCGSFTHAVISGTCLEHCMVVELTD